MLLIAHRGLMRGPNPVLENHPEQILGALEQGFDCEIDLWYAEDRFMLGHDSPTYAIDLNFLSNPRLWIHCKNHAAMREMRRAGGNFFWHQTDDMVLTNHGFFWTWPGKTLYDCSIAVMPEWHMSIDQAAKLACFGICSDHVQEIKELRGR